MQAFVIADVHGFYDEMILALNAAGYNKNNPQHCLISLGDLLDRGPKPLECLQFVNNIPENNKILIRGNHEDLIEDAIRRGEFLYYDYRNGTVQTAIDLTYEFRLSNSFEILAQLENHEELQKYLHSCTDYYENNNSIFVHGWIPCEDVRYKGSRIKFEYDPDWRFGNWKKARWICGFDAWDSKVVEPNKTIWCGHWHTSYAHSKYHMEGVEWYANGEKAIFTPFADVGIVGMDACTAYSGFVNCRKIGRFKK